MLPNALYYGDNLDLLTRHIVDDTIDLIYLDPPFNSSRNFNLLFKQHKGDPSPAQIRAFDDTWKWSSNLQDDFAQIAGIPNTVRELIHGLFSILGRSEMMAYVLMMAPRLVQLHRVLKPTGSLYLHCDHTASAYLRLLLDAIFSPTQFRNEIIWKRTSSHNDAKRRMGNVADTIFFYSKTDDYAFEAQYGPHNAAYLSDAYRHQEADGRHYRFDNIASPNDRPNLKYVWQGFDPPRLGWRYSLETMDKLYAEGKVVFTETMRPCRKRYADEMPGTPIDNVWTDIKPVQSKAKERRGYPTQKPLALLDRILAMSSKEGDLVLDPFCGCGTAVIAAQRMKRRWIGMDITYLAIGEIMDRLDTETDALLGVDYHVQGIPKDDLGARAFFQSTKAQNHKPFEMWAVDLVGGQGIEKRGGDRGIDGRMPLYEPSGALRFALIQVKGGHLAPTLIRDFAHVIARDNAPFGMFICLEQPTPKMYEEADTLGVIADFGTRRIPRLQILTIKELLEEDKHFMVPTGYRPLPEQGVGRQQPQQTQLTLG